MRLDLDDLSLFRHAAEAGSIAAAAGRANLALAAASTRIRNMEAAAGAMLFEQSRGGVTLTPAGHALLAHARALLAGAERMREDLDAYAGGGAAGHVRVLSNTNALTKFLPEALGRFLAAHPQATVDLQERLSDEIVGLVAEGVAELGIVAATANTGGLETYPFRTDCFVLVVPRSHALAGRSGVAFSDVLDHDLVGLDQTSALQRFLAVRAAKIGLRPKLRVRLRSFDGICRMVEAGVGVGIVPETTARVSGRTLAIEAVPLVDGVGGARAAHLRARPCRFNHICPAVGGPLARVRSRSPAKQLLGRAIKPACDAVTITSLDGRGGWPLQSSAPEELTRVLP